MIEFLISIYGVIAMCTAGWLLMDVYDALDEEDMKLPWRDAIAIHLTSALAGALWPITFVYWKVTR